jgi:hypothetical protein
MSCQWPALPPPEVVHDEEVGGQVGQCCDGKVPAEHNGVDTKHEGDEGHEQEGGGGEDVAEVGPGAVGVEPLHCQAQAIAGHERAVLEGEEDLHVALGPAGALAEQVARVIGCLALRQVLTQVAAPAGVGAGEGQPSVCVCC